MVATLFKRSPGMALVIGLMLCAGAITFFAQQRPAAPAADDADQPVRTSIRNPNAVAVVVAIEEYQNSRDVPKVEFAVNDAEAVRRVLTQTLGYSDSRVLFRTNGQVSVGRLKLLIQQDLGSRVIKGQSDVFVYYSGHGAPNADTKEGYLIPWDYDPQYVPSRLSAYSLKELYTDLADLGARSVTVVLEACFSGVSEGGALTKDASPLSITVDNPAAMLSNGIVITASGAREIATWHRDRKHGLMTYFWLHAMHGEAGDAQGRVTPEGLKRYLQEKVPPMAQQLRGRNQTPDVIASNSDRVLAQLPISALRSGEARLVETFGSLEVAIDLGGDLAIDGVTQGTIPAGRAFRQEKLPAGPHQIEVRKDGYEPIQEQVVISADQLERKAYKLTANLPTTPRLDRSYGLIEVTVDRGGTLYVDDKKMEDLPPFGRYTTPRIDAGPHRVRVEKQGFVTEDREVLLRPNETARLELALRPVPAPSAPPAPSVPARSATADRPATAPARDAATGMEFVKIQPGEFMMGCSSGDSQCAGDEKPAHRVRITKGFEIGKYEVTQAQWESMMGSNPSHFKGANLPVETVSWEDVQAFLQRLNAKQDGYRYRLPTEAEWEYATRAGTTGAYAGSLDAMGWYNQNSGSQTHPVGQKQPNPWGLHDMHGNVWEWVQDWYETYYGGSPQSDPTGPPSGQYRVLRGGSWGYGAGFARVSGRRLGYNPSERSSSLGFRCVREVIP